MAQPETATRPQRRKTPPPHGDHRRYRYWQCRCPPCREGERLRAKRWREGRARPEFVPAVGSVRRVQALVAYGWTYAALAEQLGCTDSWLAQLARADRPRGMLRRTAEQMADLFDRLTALPPPTGRGAAYARTVAARQGWVSPWAWDDIDSPAERPKGVPGRTLAGRPARRQHPTLTQEERRQAIHQLWATGQRDEQIADRLGMTVAAVHRTRMRQRWTRPAGQMQRRP